MRRIRGFEPIEKYIADVIRPTRKTASSAGYDLAAVENTVLAPHKVTLVATGVKAYMPDDEYLGIYVRSGFSIKNNVSCVNSVGIIDADYYGNEENEGHIMIPLINHGDEPVKIEKGTRVAQGIFHKYFPADGDAAGKGLLRTGGFGSTGV